MKSILIIVILATFLLSCNYSKTNRRHHFVQKQYLKEEPLLIKDAIICANFGNSRIRHIEINRDSVFWVFVNSFQKLPIEFDIRRGKTMCYKDFLKFGVIKYKKINFEVLSPLIDTEAKNVLLPLISYNYNLTKSPVGGFTPDPLEKNAIVDLAVLIFRDKKLVYFKSRFYATERAEVSNEDQSIDFFIKQENIDTLVKLTMKDYIERLR